MVEGQSGGDGQATVNQSAGRPKGIRRVSKGYPEGLTGRYGGSVGLGLGWRRRGAGENGGEWIETAPGKGRPLHLSSARAFSTSGFKTPYPAALLCKPSSVKSRRSFPS
jgi:hypothetical protein